MVLVSIDANGWGVIVLVSVDVIIMLGWGVGWREGCYWVLWS